EGEAGRPAAPRAAPRATAGLGLELEDLSASLARQLGFAKSGGALVARVLPGTPAARKDIGPDHRILEIDRQPVASAAEARSRIRRARTGDVLSLLLEYPDGRTYIANLRVP